MKKYYIYLFAAITFGIIYWGCRPPQTGQQAATQTNVQATAPGDPYSYKKFLDSIGTLAMNAPDEFNWLVFLKINKKAPDTWQKNISGKASNNAIWETWADDGRTFPSNDTAPTWPTTNNMLTSKKLTPITQQIIRRLMMQRMKKVKRFFIEPNGASEEVRRDKASFDYIVQNGLWNQAGLKKAYDKAKSASQYNPITFPSDAIEIKADWRPISKDSMSFFHWNYDATGTLYGLVALHIMTKEVPNWTWATWEWVGNPGRCDYIGCHDTFGVVPENVPSYSGTKQQYPPGSLTPRLLQLFKDFGVSDEWKYYRLKGSQTDFTDATGKTTLLGNSILEKGFVPTASCIGCHAYASFNSQGLVNQNFVFVQNSGDSLQSPNGIPADTTFWHNPADAKVPSNIKNMQADFVWGFITMPAS